MSFDNPIDGERLPLIHQGVKWVMEYDASTGGWKPVVGLETIIAVTVTGATVSLTQPTRVRVQDGLGEQLNTVNPGGSLYTDVQELGPALPLASDSNNLTSYSGTFIGSVLYGGNTPLARRIGVAVDADNESVGTLFNLNTAGYLRGYDLPINRWQRLRVEPSGSYGLRTSLWAQEPGTLTEGFAGFDRLRLDSTKRLMTSALVTGSVNATPVGLTQVRGVVDANITQPVGPGGAEIAATATGVLVQSRLYAFDSAANQWGRVEAGISGSIGVDLFTQLEATQDEITAYVTGSIVTLPSSRMSLVNRADVAIASPVASNATDNLGAAGQATGVLTEALAYAFDEVGGNWDRMRGDLVRGLRADMISGSFPWKNLIRATITASGSGGNATIVAAVPGQRITVMSVKIITDGNNQITWRDGAGGAILSGPDTLPSSGDGYFLQPPENPDHYHFRTSVNTALVLDRSQISLLGGHIQYYLEP